MADLANDKTLAYIKVEEIDEVIKSILGTSSTIRRISALKLIVKELENPEVPKSRAQYIFETLVLTYPLYHDGKSRKAVQACFVAGYTNPKFRDTYLMILTQYVEQEASRMSVASSSKFVLLEWSSLLLGQVSETQEYFTKFYVRVLMVVAILINSCMATPGIRSTLLKNAKRIVQSHISRVILNNISEVSPETLVQTTITKLAEKSSFLGQQSAVLLGLFCKIVARSTIAKNYMTVRLKSNVYSYYVREILGSRTVVPIYLANSLSAFFSLLTTLAEFETELLPHMERATLRSPEVVLHDLIPCLVISLNNGIDLSYALYHSMLRQLLSNVKSANPTIRDGAVLTFKEMIRRSKDEAIMSKIFEEVMAALTVGKATSAEQRLCYIKMLCTFPSGKYIYLKLPAALIIFAKKEPNESVLVHCTHAVLQNYFAALRNHDINKDNKLIVDGILEGLSEKRLLVRRAWIMNTGWMLLSETKGSIDECLLAFIKLVMPKLSSAFEEVFSNVLPSVQTGMVIAGYVFISLLFSETLQKNNTGFDNHTVITRIAGQCLSTESKLSFLLSPKVYTKLSSDDEHLWACRAFSSMADHVVPGSSTSEAWASGMLYLLYPNTSSVECRRQNLANLSALYLRNPAQIGSVVIEGIWLWLQQIDALEKDSPANISKSKVSNIINALKAISVEGSLGLVERPVRELQLVKMCVLSHHQLLRKDTDWIRSCQFMGVDPGELVSRYAQKLLDDVVAYASASREKSSTRTSAFNATATLAFVNPDVFTPIVVREFTDKLFAEQMNGVGPLEIAIWQTDPSVTYVNVIEKGPSNVASKNTKDYDTLKWEAEVRDQLLKKKGQTSRKLTIEEDAKVREQLSKERNIRAKVETVALQLTTGIGLVSSLATGFPNRIELWLGDALEALLRIMEKGAGLIVGEDAVDVYMLCAKHVSVRLGPLRQFVGVATLRAYQIEISNPDLLTEDVGSLSTRVLYKLRFVAEQRPLDTSSLIYTLPLVIRILENGGIGKTMPEEVDEQILLSLEFLSLHTESFIDNSLPRELVIRTLVHCMRSYNAHYKIVKDCLIDLCRCCSTELTKPEIVTLISAVISPESNVRNALLQAIEAEVDLSEWTYSSELWLACHDEVEENADIARTIWEVNSLSIEAEAATNTLHYLESQHQQLRRAAARSLAEAINDFPEFFANTMASLFALYRERNKPIVPLYDEFGMQKKVAQREFWESRSGIALAFKELAEVFEESSLTRFVQDLIEYGCLGDKNNIVRDEMIDAASTIISIHGKSHVEHLMKVFEQNLEANDVKSDYQDRTNEAIIVLYGALARHLERGDRRLPGVIQRLLNTLSTPSENVQYAVAECLSPLIKSLFEEAPKYITQMLDKLFSSKKYAARRGAAYGLGGIIRGVGISALKDCRVMSILRGATENKKDTNARQGALFGYELLSLILGPVFEPYVIQILPQLLASFGDGVIDVREACSDTARVCFSSLSSYGVKVILPTLLEGLDEPAWRSKKGACEMLGAMAYLAPNQLAISLPTIIPPLSNVLTDTHKEVRAAANRSLMKFGEVISNPEIKELVGILLKALSDPTKYTDDALDALMKISFVHYLDAPSLALVVRILERGLGDRSATKRKASQIIGSLAHLTERKDMIVHIPILVSGLKSAIVDPVPATRSTASKALGTLVEKLGEDALPDLIPELMFTLKSETGAGDRLGSAQALSEVLAGLGTARLEETLPMILLNATSSKASIREGFMSLFIFLPACFGNSFSAYLSRIIPPILSGLADEVDSIRETALRAGRLLVKNFATRAIDLLLPELERGLADDAYRIRLSSVELVGDLLFNLTGVTANSEEDVEASGEVSQSLLDVLGIEKRDRVLSALYICRCDTSGLVRNAAIGVWKALVSSPRTLKDLVPTLTLFIIQRLASPNPEQKVIAGQALGELIRKAGDGVLSTLLPTLEEGLLQATDTDAKQGICIALKEVITSTALEVLEEYESTLIAVVRTALVDSDEEVRDSAAEAFDSLQRCIGKRAVDQVLPYLLNLLRTESEASNALAALLTLLTEPSRSNIILPNLIPTLLTTPISSFNARALANLAEVSGSAINRRLSSIINSLVDNILCSSIDAEKAELGLALDRVLLSVDEYDGLNTAMNVMLTLAKHDDHKKRAIITSHMANFFAESEVDYSRYTPDCIRVLLNSFDDKDTIVVTNSWEALNHLTKKLRKEEMEGLVISTRQALQSVGYPGTNLAGFALPKGINAILPIFLQGLMYGTPEQRMHAALGISDIIDRASSESLRPFVTQITGPLIRVVSERSLEVKAAILQTLNIMLEKIPSYLKPFLPQLQRTFAKALADTSSELLRTRAAKALGTLITLTPRIDPLIAELVAGAKTNEVGVRVAMLKAMYEVVSKAGKNMGDVAKISLMNVIEEEVDENDDDILIGRARLFGTLVQHFSSDVIARHIRIYALSQGYSKLSVLGLNAVLLESPAVLASPLYSEETPQIICKGLSHKNPFVSDNSVLAAGKYLLTDTLKKSFENSKAIFEALMNAITRPESNSTDTKRLALAVVRTTSRLNYDLVKPHLGLLAPAIFSCVRDMVIPVKLSAEQAFIAILQTASLGDIVFDKYIVTLEPPLKRSMQDYYRRVATKLASAERERNEAGGSAIGLKSDEDDDIREIMSIGKVDLEGWISQD